MKQNVISESPLQLCRRNTITIWPHANQTCAPCARAIGLFQVSRSESNDKSEITLQISGPPTEASMLCCNGHRVATAPFVLLPCWLQKRRRRSGSPPRARSVRAVAVRLKARWMRSRGAKISRALAQIVSCRTWRGVKDAGHASRRVFVAEPAAHIVVLHVAYPAGWRARRLHGRAVDVRAGELS